MLSLFKREKIYWLKVRTDEKLLRLSLGTRDKIAANALKTRIEIARAEGLDSPKGAELRSVLPARTFSSLAAVFGWRECSASWAELKKLFEEDMARRTQCATKRKLSTETVERYSSVLDEFGIFVSEQNVASVRGITQAVVEGYKIWRRARILKRKAARNASSMALDAAVLHRVFNFARSLKMVVENPVLTEGTPGTINSEDAGAQPFNADQLLSMRQKAGKDFLIFVLLRNTGLRRSDAVKLTWREIDFKSQIIRRRTQKRGKIVEIPLMPELLVTLEFERDRRKPAPSDVVLLSPATGCPMSPRKLTARVRALGARAGVQRATPHCFRDTFAVDLLHKGIDIFTVAKLLGDTVAVVEKHYARFVTELRERARRMMVSGAGLEGTIQDTIDPGVPVTEGNKELEAAGPVSRILSAGLLRWDGHSSGPRIAARL